MDKNVERQLDNVPEKKRKEILAAYKKAEKGFSDDLSVIEEERGFGDDSQKKRVDKEENAGGINDNKDTGQIWEQARRNRMVSTVDNVLSDHVVAEYTKGDAKKQKWITQEKKVLAKMLADHFAKNPDAPESAGNILMKWIRTEPKYEKIKSIIMNEQPAQHRESSPDEAKDDKISSGDFLWIKGHTSAGGAAKEAYVKRAEGDARSHDVENPENADAPVETPTAEPSFDERAAQARAGGEDSFVLNGHNYVRVGGDQYVLDPQNTTQKDTIEQNHLDHRSEENTSQNAMEELHADITELERMLAVAEINEPEVDAQHWVGNVQEELAQKRAALAVLENPAEPAEGTAEDAQQKSEEIPEGPKGLARTREQAEAENRAQLSPEVREAMEKLESVRTAYVQYDRDMDRASGIMGRIIGKKKRPTEGTVYDDFVNAKTAYDTALQAYIAAVMKDEESVDPNDKFSDLSVAQSVNNFVRMSEFVALDTARREQTPTMAKFGDKIRRGLETYRGLSWKTKLAIGGGLFAATTAAGSIGAATAGLATATLVARQGLRVIGLGSLWVGSREQLEQKYDKELQETAANENYMLNTVLGDNAEDYAWVRGQALEEYLRSVTDVMDEKFQGHKDRAVRDRWLAAYKTGKWAAVFGGIGYLAGHFLSGGGGENAVSGSEMPSTADTTPPSDILQSNPGDVDFDAIAPISGVQEATPKDFLSHAEQQHLEDIEAFNTFDIKHPEESIGSMVDHSTVDVNQTYEGAVNAEAAVTDMGGVVEHASSAINDFVGIEPHGDVAGVLRIPQSSSVEGALITFLAANHEHLTDGGMGWDPERFDSVEEWAGKRAHGLALEYMNAHSGVDLSHVTPGTVLELDLSNLSDSGNIGIDVHPQDVLGEKMMDGASQFVRDGEVVTETVPTENVSNPVSAALESLTNAERQTFLRDIGSTMREVFTPETLENSTMFGTGTVDNFHYNPDAISKIPVNEILQSREGQWYGEDQAASLHRFIAKAMQIVGRVNGAVHSNETVETYLTRTAAYALQKSPAAYETLFKKPL